MILSASDLIIFATLVLNALALVSGKQLQSNYLESSAGQEPDEASRDLLENADDPSSPALGYFNSARSLTTVMWDSRSPLAQHVFRAVRAVRRYSCMLIAWNAAFMCLMVLVFRE